MQQLQTTLPVGSIVIDRYQVEELLGKGGFGAVYLVRDLRVQQNVFALKEVADLDQRKRRHFTLEADLLKRTDHPSLPRVYRAFDDPSRNRAYMLMDYIEGLDLEQLRRKQPEQRFPLHEVFALLGPIVEAVAYLHAQQPKIIHRDIKPSNIIAPSSGERPVLVDFGIAKEFAQNATTTAVRHASPGYGAPEQYSSGTDVRTDVYGLGATVYALLTGTVPTDAFVRMTRYLSKKDDPLPPVRQLVPTIPEHVSAAIERAMALESQWRFASVMEFWQALQDDAFLAPPSSSLNARPVGSFATTDAPRVDHAPSPSRAPSRVRWLAILLLVLIALGLGFASALLLLPGLRGQQAHSPAATPGRVVTHTAPPTPSPQPTQAPTQTPIPSPSPSSTIPSLAPLYTGTIHDNNGNLDASMSLNGIVQQQQNVQGNFVVSPPLSGSGPFTGTVTANGSIQFTVHSSSARAPLHFSGNILKDGSISGSYCSLDSTDRCNPNVGGYGTWSVRPGNSALASGELLSGTVSMNEKTNLLDSPFYTVRIYRVVACPSWLASSWKGCTLP